MIKEGIIASSGIAIATAFLAVASQLTIPLPLVPLTLQTLAVGIIATLLKPLDSILAICLYLILGAIGIPVFAGGAAGFGVILGPTGGYLIGFIFMALIGGAVIELSHRNIFLTMLGWVVGTAVAYAFGTVWFVYLMKCSVTYALTVCVYPFIGFDIVKIVIATLLVKTVRYAITKAGLIQKAA